MATLEELREGLIRDVPFFHKRYSGSELSPEESRRAVNAFLTLARIHPAAVDLQTMSPRGILWGSKDRLFVNLLGVLPFLESLAGTVRVRDDVKEMKGELMEAQIEDYLGNLGQKVFAKQSGRTAKAFRLNGQILGQADCCRLLGSVLILVDAKAYSVPEAFHRGEYSAVRTRGGYLRKWVHKADWLSNKLSKAPVGDNYNLLNLGIRHVLAIICTPYPEYIPERSSTFFLNESVPRIATPEEIVGFLKRNTPEALASNPNTKRIEVTRA